MATNFIQPGECLEFTAPTGGVTSGTPLLIGSLLVVPLVTAAATVKFNGCTCGVFKVTKADSQAWTEGVKVYWDDTNKNFTTTSTANTLCGVAAAAVASTAGLTTGYVRLDGVAR
jgi:predicted RecA/RadA family phage recombinase